MKKIVIFLICLFLLFGVTLPACKKETNTDDKINSGIAASDDNADQINTDESQADTDIKILPDLPGDLNFGGYKFRALYSSVDEAGVWGLRDIVAAEENGEVINDAVYARNKILEDRYNFEISGTPTTSSTMTSSSIRRLIQSGSDEYDVLFVRQNQTGDLISNGCLVDLNTVLYLDFDKPWWDRSIIDQLSICKKIFAASGDIISTNNNAFRVVMFNKKMLLDFGLADPYKLVRENKWNLDNFYDLCKNASLDVNGDGKMDQNDRYGCLVQSGCTINLFFAAGQQTVVKEENVPSASIGSEKNIMVLEKINNILSSKDAVMFDSDYTGLDSRGPEYVLMTTFEDKRGLFFSEVLQLAERMRATDTDFGILPPPKADENQPEYICFADSYCINLMLIPATNTNLDRTGQILEAMCAESKYGLLPAYYEKTLKSKYSRDNDSEEMLDIIIKNKVISLDEMFGWGMYSAIQGELQKRSGNFAAVIEKNIDKVQIKVIKTIEKIESLD